MILFEKFGQHQPLNRQAERYPREGVQISLSTMADAVGASCPHSVRAAPTGSSTEFGLQFYPSVSLICCPIPDSRDRIHDVVGSDADAAPQYMSICHSGSVTGGGNITKS
jgi:Transposase IS66 family